MSGEGLRKIPSDRGYRGDVAEDIEKDFGIELEVSNTPNGVKDSCQNHLDGWSRGLSHGLIHAADSPEIMKQPMNPLKK